MTSISSVEMRLGTRCQDDVEFPLSVLQLGMHERGSGGGVDRVFWDQFDNLALFSDLTLKAFYFRHRLDPIAERPGEVCLGSTSSSGYCRLWNLRQAVLRELKANSKKNPTVVVSHFAFYAAALLPNLARLNHVVHFHGPWAVEAAAEGRSWLNVIAKRCVERAIYSSAKAFVTLSQAFKDLLTNEYRIDSALVHVIPAAVDLQHFSPGDRGHARTLLGWPQDASILLCVRRLVRRMGLENLLEAFHDVAGEHPDSLLVIGGAGPLRDELETKIRSYGLGERVRLTGFIPDADLAVVYRAADLSIVPSQSLEGFGLTTIESLACGRPVLVTPVGGLPEVVGRLDPQLVLSDNSSAALAQSLHLFLDGKLFVPSAEECRRYVEMNFAWPKVAGQARTLYYKVATS